MLRTQVVPTCAILRATTGNRRVKHWQAGGVALRWTAAGFAASAENFRRIMGYEHLWMLKAALDEQTRDTQLVHEMKAG